eukprot:6172405-Pleurochrysis_carterae.AAC.2
MCGKVHGINTWAKARSLGCTFGRFKEALVRVAALRLLWRNSKHPPAGCFTPPMLLDVEKGLDHKKGQEHAPRNTSD